MLLSRRSSCATAPLSTVVAVTERPGNLERAPRDRGAEARQRIRALHAASGRRIAVLDDDPTGSQSVHDVEVVTSITHDALIGALRLPGSCCFVLTNTRSLDENGAVALNLEVARLLHAIGAELDAPIELVSRSDSTLRGHVYAELRALDASRREALGEGYQATLFAPAFLEAGRFTEGDVHFARVDGVAVPVGETEFARDATFAYRSSNLGDFLVEKSDGAIARDAIISLGFKEIRAGGSARVAEVLGTTSPGSFVIVNATEYTDLEEVALGVALSEGSGRAFLHRCGPSFVRALCGIEPRPPLRSEDLYPGGAPSHHGLIVVGSHVGLTNAQLAIVQQRPDLVSFELDAAALADERRRASSIEESVANIVRALEDSDVLIYTSRTLLLGTDADSSLSIARAISAALVEIVAASRRASPAWVIAKGGITSHDVALRGLEIRRARVRGQLLPGMVSVFQPTDAPAEVLEMPFVVFAGNVGDESTLDFVVEVLKGAR